MLNLTNRDRCFVIAEAGTAHLGNRDKAYDLLQAAVKAGADAIKFQFFSPIVSQQSMFCWIQGDAIRVQRWRRSYLPLNVWREVKRHAEIQGLVFLASTFEHETVAWLNELGVVATKVASRAAKNFPYDMDGLPRPFLISDGMGLPTLLPHDHIKLSCEAAYPSTRAWEGKLHRGFSDHSGAPFLGIDAIARGCKLLEVHFMIDPIDAGPDLPACLTLDELKLVCQARDYYSERKAA